MEFDYETNQNLNNGTKLNDSAPVSRSKMITGSQIDWQLQHLTFSDATEKNSSRYFMSSFVLHSLLALLIANMTIPLIEPKKIETITIDLKDEPLKIKIASQGEPVPANRAKSENPKVLEKKVRQPISPKISTNLSAATGKSKSESKIKSSAASLPDADESLANVAYGKTSSVSKNAMYSKASTAKSASIDDLQPEDIDTSAIKAAPIQHFADAEVADAVARSNSKHQAKAQVSSAASDLSKQIAASSGDLEDSASSVAASIRQDNARRGQIANAERSKRNSALAGQLASLNATEPSTGTNGTAAAMSGANGNLPTTSKDGAGAGNNGLTNAGNDLAGYPDGTRSLDQLRQRPGNPRPQYANDERLNGHQGQVTFVAYVTKDGSLTNFKMIQGTGFRNLDKKTLAALKQWKFYSGQEGWVELPFSWNLKGGPQQMPTLLRRKL